MSRWKDKESFLTWVAEQKTKALHDFKALTVKGSYDQDIMPFDSVESIASLNAYINIDMFADTVDDKVLEHLNYIMGSIDIELIHLHKFLSTVNSVNFFNKSEIGTVEKKDKNYEQRISDLKRVADDLQYYSPTQIRIRLPIQPHVSRYELRLHLERYKVDNDVIAALYSYFEKERMQKLTPAYTKRKEEWNTLLAENTELSIMGHINSTKETMHYYEAER